MEIIDIYFAFYMKYIMYTEWHNTVTAGGRYNCNWALTVKNL
jgi:hypothetical protein